MQEKDGNWTVWDHDTHAPARLGGDELRGKPRERAEAARDVLSRIFNNGMDVATIRNSRRG
jgi:hypothetical protein